MMPTTHNPTSKPAEVSRLLRLISIVKSHPGIDRELLAQQLNVDLRSISRYINKLRDAGVDISSGQRGYRLNSEIFFPPLQLTADEALSIMALCQSPAAREQLSMLGPLDRAVTKLAEQLPPLLKSDVNDMLDHVLIRAAPASESKGLGDLYSRIKRALHGKRLTLCRYENRGGHSSQFHFAPYALYFGVRAWYVIGRHIEKQDVRTLRLSRMSHVNLLDDTFTIPRAFSVERYLGNAWSMVKGEHEYDVELLFSRALSETISETRWHKTQRIEHLDDGTIRFRCTVDGLDEIVWWILSMGASCRVIQPEALRTRVKEEAQNLLDLYTAPSARQRKAIFNEAWTKELAELQALEQPSRQFSLTATPAHTLF